MSETESIQAQAPGSIQAAVEAFKTAQQAPVETGTPAPEVKKTEDTDFSRRFAALSKRQKDLFNKEQELKKQELRYKELEEIESLREKNPLEYLKKKNMNFDDLLSSVLKENEPPTVEDKLTALEKKIEAYQKAEEEKALRAKEEAEKAAKENEQKAIDGFKKEIDAFIKSDVEKYELINANGATEMVFEVISENYQKTQQVMPTEEAAQLVEAYLEQELDKILKLKKVASKFGPKPEEKLGLNPVDKMQQQAPHLLTQTLKSTVTPSASSSTSDANLSFEERMEKAKALMRQTGNFR